MKILYVSQYFPPEMGAPAARVAELASHWARLKHETTVLTGFPNHPIGIVPEDWKSRFHRLRYTENVEGVTVARTWLWPLPNRKTHERIRNYTSFFFSSALAGLGLPKPDVVIATSPQLLCALAGWWIAFWKRVPFVFEVRDLWPESLVAVGAGKEGGLLHRTLGVIAAFLYRHADRIVVVSPAFKDHLIRHWKISPQKISIVVNGVETELFRFDPAADQLRKELKLEGRFLICYIGTIGHAHGLETLISAAEQLRTALPEAMFLLIGEGAEKERIIELARARGLTNIRFLDQKPREEIPAYVSAADVCLVMLKKNELFKTVIPTKLLEYMACERPVVVAVDGQARQIAEESRGGVFVEPENCADLVKALLSLANNPEQRRQMGANGRIYLVKNFSRKKTAEEYIQVLETVLDPLASRERTA